MEKTIKIESGATLEKILQPKSNIANKVRNTKLPKTKPLMPLFEVISNSIHAINEAKKGGILMESGEIKIKVIRNGNEGTFKEMEQVDLYPVKSFEVTDNGIGLNDENLNYFVESDTDHKIEIGGKGVGRFVCLKAFNKLIISSTYVDEDKFINRQFTFNNTKKGFDNFNETEVTNNNQVGTTIILSDYKEDFQKHVPRPISLIVREIITHFQLYFIRKENPSIFVTNQNEDFIDCQHYFETNFAQRIRSKKFNVAEFEFELFLTKSISAQSHKLLFCAHNRTVREESLYNRIVDLGKYPINNEDGNFYYQAFVVGKVLDDSVDLERIGFTFPIDEEEDDIPPEELTLSKIRREAIVTIETMLSDYLNKIRDEKIAKYKPVIYDELPQYQHIFNSKISEVKKLQPNLSKEKLDIELYKIDADWKLEVKKEGVKILDEKKDIQNLEEYKLRYEKFLEDFNEVGKSDLARYVVHRKAVIELLDKLLEKQRKINFLMKMYCIVFFFRYVLHLTKFLTTNKTCG